MNDAVARVDPLGTSGMNHMVIAERISVPQPSGVDACYRTESSMWMRANSHLKGGLVAWKEVLPVVQAIGRGRCAQIAEQGKGLFDVVGPHGQALGLYDTGEFEMEEGELEEGGMACKESGKAQ